MKVVWTRLALDDLESIREFIEVDNPRAAVRVALRILKTTRVLEATPSIGRPGRVRGTREFVMPGLPYIIAYRMQAGVLEILRVLHGARRWPRKLRR
jgi:addiction module RelE/StbE family toxin